MKIYFATDHAGFELKEKLVAFVRDTLGHEVIDCGAYSLEENDDYPLFIKKAGEAVSQNPNGVRAIILGGSGQGEAMVANKYASVRATVFYGGPHEIITLSREHNDANVLSLGARFLSLDEAQEVVSVWLSTSFSHDERHVRRITEMDALK